MALLKKDSKTKIQEAKKPQIKKAEAKKPTVKLADLNVSELQNQIKDVRAQLNTHTVAVFSGKEKNLRKQFVLRKQLARLLTILGQKKV